MFIPYKYSLYKGEKNIHTLKIACRNSQLERRVFDIEVEPLSYIEVSTSIGDIEDNIKLLKSLLNTEYVSYNINFNRYVVKGMIGVDDNIKNLFKSTVTTPLLPSFMLQTLDRKYFDQIDNNGKWTGIKADSSNHITILWSITTYDTNQMSENGGHESNNCDNTEVITITFKKISDKEVQIWSTVPSINSSRYFNKEDDMLKAFFAILCECDINITYGGKQYEWNYLLSKLSHIKSEICYKYDSILGNISYRELNEPTIDHIDLIEIINLMYPHLSDYKFETIAKNLLGENYPELENMTMYIKADKEGNSSIFQKEKLKNYSDRLHKNLNNLEAIYHNFLPIITNLVYLSGCNWGSVSKVDTFRSILGYINPIIVNNNLINKLPEEYLTRGIYDTSYLTPISSIIHNSLINSKDKSTQLIGEKLVPLSGLTWIMKSIYNLEGLLPLKIQEYNNVFGFQDDCFFSRSLLPDIKTIEHMNKMLVISNDSWIGITAYQDNKITFIYKGLSEACQHPFLAVKQCIELYLLTLTTKTKIDKKVAIQATSLLKETAVIAKKVTKSNLSQFDYLLNDSQISSIKNKKIDFINLKVYYSKDNKYTVDYNNIHIPTYKEHLEKIMKTIPE